MLRLFHGIQDMLKIEDLIFDERVDVKWNLLLWSIGMDSQLRFDLENIPERYVHTVLALKFLRKVIMLRICFVIKMSFL